MDGFDSLGNVLQGNMTGTARALSGTPVEMGLINSDYSLSTDSFKVPIPSGDYMIDRLLTSNHGLTIEDTDGHTHEVKVSTLKPGDRVLVARAGNERVVISVLTNAI